MADLEAENPFWPSGMEVDPQSALGQRGTSYAAMANLTLAGKNALVGALAGARDLVTTPGDVWAGKYSPSELPGVARDYAINMSASGLAVPAPPGSLAMTRGYHGTPHTFDEFSNDAIGSGEGVQAYGYGHYVAGNPKVAEGYRQTLTDKSFINKIKEEYGEHDSPEDAEAALFNSPAFNPQEKELLSALKEDDYLGFDYPHQAVSAALRRPQDWDLSDRTKAALGNVGNLLEVAIKPDEHELLDWDKPLSQQPPGVQAGIDKLEPDWNKNYPDEYNSLTGEQFYKRMQGWQDHTGAAASAALHEAGIPGIKYLDAGSRGPRPSADEIATAQRNVQFIQNLDEYPTKVRDLQRAQDALARLQAPPTSNYVIFDPSNIKITARNGQRLVPVEHDPWGQEP